MTPVRRAAARRSPDAGRRVIGPPRRRLVGLLCVLTLLFVGVIGRLADLQLVAAERYVAYGTSQRLRTETLPASRGSLLDREGAELVMSVPSHTVVADPRLVEDPAAAAGALAPILGTDVGTLQVRLSSGSAFEYLARQIDDETAAAVRAASIEGVFLQTEPSRTYPAGDTAQAVLGRADIDGVGVSGLEQQFDDILTGTPGEVIYERSLNGVAIPVGEHQIRPARPGDDVVLTIDRSLQYVVEQALAEQIEATGAEGGGMAVVMVPGTGEVLAMANLVVDEETGEIRAAGYNRALVDVFTPGSVIKVVTVGASLEEGLSTPERQIEVPYRIPVGPDVFTDSTLHETEMWSVRRILVESSNVGAIKLGRELGNETVGTYLDRFGFGHETGLGFPGEAAGIVKPWEDWYGSDIAGHVIGTGVATTAMQVLAAYNAIANDGVYVPPRLVEARVDADGTRHPMATDEPHRVVSESTAHDLVDMLTGVVEDGTGTNAAVAGYDVAGKTGTAWKMQSNGTFETAAGDREYMATFVGFAPVEDPRISVIVVVDEPRNVHSGGSAAAPAFARIAEHALRMLDVAPSGGEDGTGSEVVTVASTPEERVRATPAAAPEDNQAGEVAAGADR